RTYAERLASTKESATGSPERGERRAFGAVLEAIDGGPPPACLASEAEGGRDVPIHPSVRPVGDRRAAGRDEGPDGKGRRARWQHGRTARRARARRPCREL